MATSFSDYSNPYITEIYNQKKQAAADALTSAYQQNMANYDAQEQQTAQNYDNQRNQTQAQYEKALRNFDEYSGANGLNSGAKAQARLAYGNQNQAGLSNLSAAESAALQQIARDRAAPSPSIRPTWPPMNPPMTPTCTTPSMEPGRIRFLRTMRTGPITTPWP